MPYKDPEKERERSRKRYWKNPQKESSRKKEFRRRNRNNPLRIERDRKRNLKSKKYRKQWQKDHPEKRREYSRRKYQKHKEKMLIYRHQRYQKNKKIECEKSKLWKKNNPEKVKVYMKRFNQSEKGKDKTRRANLKKLYDLTIEQYDQMYQSQKGVCAICGKAETAKNQYGIKRLGVDHCHTTNQVRGLLCGVCNFKLSVFEDTKFCEKVKRYLALYKEK